MNSPALIITRPLADSRKMAARLEKMGIRAIISPVIELVCLEGVKWPQAEGFAGLIITSRNALECMSRAGISGEWRSLPLFAVGKASAARARELGFEQVLEASGKAASLPPLIEQRLEARRGEEKSRKNPQSSLPRLFQPGGDKIALDLAPLLAGRGFSLDFLTVYESRPCPTLSGEALEAIRNEEAAGAVLMSPRSARLFARQLESAGLLLALERLTCLCISQNAAKAIREQGARHCLTAPSPSLEAIMETILTGKWHHGPNRKVP